MINIISKISDSRESVSNLVNNTLILSSLSENYLYKSSLENIINGAVKDYFLRFGVWNDVGFWVDLEVWVD